MSCPPNVQTKHLDYRVDVERNRFHFYENYWKAVGLKLLKKYLPPSGQTILDFGCGRGESLAMYREAGYDVLGTDVDPECVTISRERGRAERLERSALEQFGRKSFDAVTCFHVLEHVENPKQTLEELGSIARRYVVVAVPNLRSLTRIFARTVELRGINPGHLQSWDHWHLRNLAEVHCGLRLVEWGFDASLLGGLSGLSSTLLGTKATIWLETSIFRRLFPFHCISVLGIFEPMRS